MLAEGIDSEEQLAAARAFGAQLGQGFLLGEPAPLPGALPEPGRKLRLTDSGGDLAGDPPFRRVTNWKRPATGSRALAEATAGLIMRQALALGETAVVLAAFPDEHHLQPAQAAELRELAETVAFVGALCAPPELAEAGVRTGQLAADDPLRGTWTVTALGPGLAACFVACESDGRDVPARHLLRPRSGRGVGAADHGPAAPARSASSADHLRELPALPGERRRCPVPRRRSSAPGIDSA